MNLWKPNQAQLDFFKKKPIVSVLKLNYQIGHEKINLY